MTERSPHGLVSLVAPDATGPSVLVHSLTGFLDAGGAGRLAVAHLLETLEHELVAEYDIDVLYDYRARRPRMTFLTDHYGEIEMPALQVSKMVDSAGSSFFLLHGPEPDFRWRAFAADTVWLVRQLGVSTVLGIHAVPWPAPHTRPVNLSAHSTDPSLIADRPKFVGDLEVPGHGAGLLEVTMKNNDIVSVGFAAHVPHYLTNSEHPRASVALLEAVSAQTGLLLPLDALRERAAQADEDVALQVNADPEHTEAIRSLEAQYDAFMAQFSTDTGFEPVSDLVDPEDFVTAVEQFLAEHDGNGETR